MTHYRDTPSLQTSFEQRRTADAAIGTLLRLGVAISLLGVFAGSALGCGGTVTGASGGGQGDGGQGGGQGGGEQGGSNSCPDFSEERFDFYVKTADGIAYGCAGLADGEVAIEGQVTAASSTDSWIIDTCLPTADCAPTLVQVKVPFGGPELDIPAGAMVNVTSAVAHYGGTCHSSLLVTNLPNWGGLPNPVATDAAPWFEIGGHSASPFTVEAIEQCHIEGECNQSYNKLRFMLKDDPSVTTAPVAIGENATLDVPSGVAKGSYLMHNVFSDSGYCEIAGSTIFWIRRAP